MGSWKRSNEPSGSIKCREFLDKLRDYQLLIKDMLSYSIQKDIRSVILRSFFEILIIWANNKGVSGLKHHVMMAYKVREGTAPRVLFFTLGTRCS
jgi:hypothetical protein